MATLPLQYVPPSQFPGPSSSSSVLCRLKAPSSPSASASVVGLWPAEGSHPEQILLGGPPSHVQAHGHLVPVQKRACNTSCQYLLVKSSGTGLINTILCHSIVNFFEH